MKYKDKTSGSGGSDSQRRRPRCSVFSRRRRGRRRPGRVVRRALQTTKKPMDLVSLVVAAALLLRLRLPPSGAFSHHHSCYLVVLGPRPEARKIDPKYGRLSSGEISYKLPWLEERRRLPACRSSAVIACESAEGSAPLLDCTTAKGQEAVPTA